MRDREPALLFAHSFPRHCMSHPPTKKSEKSSSSRRAPRALVSIVAVELGATFPAWISNGAHTGEFRVVAEREAETSAAFAERVISVMKGLFADGTAASGLVIVCNERIDDGALAARKSLIAAPARPVTRSSRPRLPRPRAPARACAKPCTASPTT
jgi:hypothetical protein